MKESFALRGAVRYLKEQYKDEELEEVTKICEGIASELAKRRGYLHPRALAAASSHIYLTQHGVPVTLEKSSSSFRISAATLREYLKTNPNSDGLENAKRVLENSLFGAELREALKIIEGLHEKLKKRKRGISPNVLAASTIYILYYRSGKKVSISEIAKRYGISASAIRDYISGVEEDMSPVDRAKRMLEQYLNSIEEEVDKGRIYEILEKVSKSTRVSTARILAAMSYYLYTIDMQRYVTIERVAREFNVSIPALRSYLEPYLASLSQTYLLVKRGSPENLQEIMNTLPDADKELLNIIYTRFGTNLFELSQLFGLGKVARGRWQLFLRKTSQLGLVNIYKKPLDPKQYCSLIPEVKNYLAKPETLRRWV